MLNQDSDDGGGQVTSEKATEHGTKAEFGEMLAAFGCQGADAADLNSDTAEIGEAAECVSGDGKAAGIERGLKLAEVDVADEFIEDDAFTEKFADGEAILGGHTHKPGERGVEVADDLLDGGLEAEGTEEQAEKIIGEGDDRGKGDKHGENVECEPKPFGRTLDQGIDTVAGGLFGFEGSGAGGFAGERFGKNDFGNHEGGGGTHDRGSEKMARAGTERSVNGEHTTRDGGHAANHQGEEFAGGHAAEIRFDDEGGFGLPHENIGRGSQALAAAGAHGFLHDERHGADDPLKNAPVIEERRERGDDDDGGADRDGQDEGVLRAQMLTEQRLVSQGTEHHFGTFHCKAGEASDGALGEFEESDSERSTQNENGEENLKTEPPGDRPPGKLAAMGGDGPGEADHQPHAKETD